MRSSATDALILALGRALHGRDMHEAGLRERIHYMYLPPLRFDTATFNSEAARVGGLRTIAQYSLRSVSPSQLRHRVTILQKQKEV